MPTGFVNPKKPLAIVGNNFPTFPNNGDILPNIPETFPAFVLALLAEFPAFVKLEDKLPSV